MSTRLWYVCEFTIEVLTLPWEGPRVNEGINSSMGNRLWMMDGNGLESSTKPRTQIHIIPLLSHLQH